MSMQKTIRVPKVTTIAEAIRLDEELVYEVVPPHTHTRILADETIGSVKLETNWIPEPIVQQLREYKPRSEGCPKVIFYRNEPVRAVSGLFKRIPLQDVWEETTKRLGEPIEEKPTNQAIIAQFEKQVTKYKRNGEIGKEDYEISPTVAFSFNFAERSFWLGYIIGVFYCTNQIFLFGAAGSGRVIHNLYHMKDFSLEKSLDTLLNGFRTVETMIADSQKEPLPDHAYPALYWKGMHGTVSYLDKVFEQPKPETLWQGIMNLTYVSTHEVENFNVAFDKSRAAGMLLAGKGKLFTDDFVRALGFYLHLKRITPERAFLEQLNLEPMKKYVRLLCKPQATLNDSLHAEKPGKTIDITNDDAMVVTPKESRSDLDHPPGWEEHFKPEP